MQTTVPTTDNTLNEQSIEWPTWILIVCVYGSWVLALSYYHVLGPWLGIACLGLIGAMHMSVQHELLHGHPTRSTWINGLLAYVPVSLIYPYPIYRESHITHHNNEHLTIPGIDPESYFVTQKHWQRSCALKRAYLVCRMTLFGRLLFGPAHSALSLSLSMVKDVLSLSVMRSAIWLLHLILVCVLLVAVDTYFSIPAWQYVIAAYLANSIAMIRSFFEHRPAETPDQRSIIMDCCPFFRTLFLNNNLHFTHHEYPGAPWYKLPALYERDKASVLQRNGEFYTPGYSRWLLNHLLKPVDSPVHPFANE